MNVTGAALERYTLRGSRRETIHAMIGSRGEQGYGHALVRETLKHAAIPLRAAVKPHNRASRGILENADFRIAGEENGLMVYMRQ
jgi:hypothetical protein